jgi:hypothetical protein
MEISPKSVELPGALAAHPGTRLVDLHRGNCAAQPDPVLQQRDPRLET